MPTLQQLRYLVAVSETLHFRRAAERTHVSQPTLSGQLRELELTLGAQLVERSRSRVLMTPIGSEIAERAKAVLRDVGEIVELGKQGRGSLAGTLRLGVLPTLGPYLLPTILPEALKAYPKLRLYVREGMPQALLDALDEGGLDLLLFPLPVAGADLESARLFREPLLVAAPTGHPLARRRFAERADLKGETVLTLERGHRLHDQVAELCREMGAKLTPDYEGTSLDTLRQMVGMGMGLTFLPALYVRAEMASDPLVAVRPFRTNAPSRDIGMIWRRKSARGKEYMALAEVVRGTLKRVPEVTAMG